MITSPPRALWVVLAVCLIRVSVSWADEPKKVIVIDKKPVEVERKTFDPKSPPPDMPRLEPHEAAITRYQFSWASNVAYSINKTGDGGSTTCTATVETLNITLGLHVVIWLPDNATPKLRSHEEGHREIAEMYYEAAEEIAEQVAAPITAKPYPATGSDCEAKIKSVMDAAINKAGEKWIEAVTGPAGRVEDIFDELTDHGRKLMLTEKDAIAQSVAQYEKDRKKKAK
jgi:hypothetical protein